LSSNDAHALAERIARGRARIAAARAQGKDTAEWERHLAALEAAQMARTLTLAPTYAPTESASPIPITPCPVCTGRRWRLHSTPKVGGKWLWVCAACADRATGVNVDEDQVVERDRHTLTEAPQ